MADETNKKPTAKNHTRPTEIDLANVPEELRETPQWECWMLRDGRKIPIDATTGKPYPKGKQDSDKMGNATFWEACELFKGRSDLQGIGFRFKSTGIHTGIDLDDVCDPATGEIVSWARDAVAEFGTYAEISPSDTGLHILGRAKLLKALTKTKWHAGHVEMYSEGRYFTITGRKLPDAPPDVSNIQPQADEWYRRLTATPAKNGDDPAAAHVEDEKVPKGEQDNWLIKRAGLYRAAGDDVQTIEKKLLIDYHDHCAPPHNNENRVRELARGVERYTKGDKFARGAKPEIPASEVRSFAKIELADMAETVLCGRLGEICQTRLGDFPIAYAWPALLAAGSAQVYVPVKFGKVLVHLYVALVGPLHSGKSQAIERANYLLAVQPVDTMAGSIEGLLQKIGDRGNDGVLLFPDELLHLFEKAQLAHAAFAPVLTRLFYNTSVELTVTQRKLIAFRGRLSIAGGLMDDKFDDAFGPATMGGLYDRFLFGRCPTGFEYAYVPLAGVPELVAGTRPELPRINGDVWEETNRRGASEGTNRRILEIGIRSALICAAFDGRKELRADHLDHAWEFVKYQERVRALLQPNPGKNYDAQVAHKILTHLQTHAPDRKFLKLRDVLKATKAYDCGPIIWERVVAALTFNGDIEVNEITPVKGPKVKLIRLTEEPEWGIS
jgi:hypothetical protein